MTVRRTSIFLAGWLILLIASSARAQGNIVWTPTAGPAGGFVNALALAPNAPGVMFAGADSGVYLTRDGGARWSFVSQGLPDDPKVNALVTLPDANVVLAGTNSGIYRTRDAGSTWTSVDPRLANQIIHALVSDPQNPNAIYAATAETVLRSDNAGETWNNAGADLKSARVWALAFAPDAATLYAATDAGIYASRDRGARWQLNSEGLPEGVRPQSIVVTARGLLAGTAQGIYRSRDAKTWSPVGGDLSSAFARPLAGDPTQPDRVLAVVPQGIAKTTDGGATWSLLANPLRELPIRSLLLSDKNVIYAGTARGVLKSSDEGALWQSLNTGFVSTTIHQLLALPGQTSLLFAATPFGLYRTPDRGANWFEARGLTDSYILSLATDPQMPTDVYAGTWSSALFLSRDGGANFTRLAENVGDKAPINSLIVLRSPEQAALIFAGTLGNGLYKSSDGGQKWSAQTNGLEGVMRVTTLVAVPPNLLYAATERGLYRLAWNQPGAAWESITANLPVDETRALIFDPRQPQTLFVGFVSNGVYRSDDGGATWTLVGRGAFPTRARLQALALNPAMPNVIYVGTTRGIYRSDDGGTTWTTANEGLPPNANVETLAVDPQSPENIFAGTNGNGVIQGIDRLQTNLPIGLLSAGAILILTLLALGLVGIIWRRRFSPVARARAAARMWNQWDAAITHALQTTGEAHAGNLGKLPRSQLASALKRYSEQYAGDALTWQTSPPLLKADNFALTQKFLSNWRAAWELVESEQAFASVTSQIVDQLCSLLGFTRVDERAYKGLVGYVVRAPALRLKIPPRFPIIFIPRHEASESDLEALRDLMGVLNMVSYFALIVDLRDAPPRDQRHSLINLAREAIHDFIVLDGRAIRRLLAARDHAHRLVEIILSQVDLTVVSPYVMSGPVPANMFFGRESELKTIVRTVRDTNFAIVGGRKIGKTSILARVLQLLQDAPEYHPFYLDCQAVHSYDDFFEAVDTMWRIALPARTPEAFRRMATELPAQYPARTIVLLFDEIDGLLAQDIAQGEQLFRIFRALAQELPIRFLFCGEKILNASLHDARLAFFNFCNLIPLSYLSPEEARRVVVDPMQEMGVLLQEQGDLAGQIISLAACHPNMVQYICQKLIERINHRRERLITRADVEAVGQSTEFAEYFAEIAWGNTTALERLITLLMLEQPAVTQGEIAEVFRTSGIQVPPDKLEEAFEGLALYSILRRDGPKYTFAAQGLLDVLRRGQDVYGLVVSYSQEIKETYGVRL
ncbi:MAG: hypothetical protein FJ009_10150 [Chloroflexi bacterium]|nr:hypothetical protein [Chloroflexota bacterium]